MNKSLSMIIFATLIFSLGATNLFAQIELEAAFPGNPTSGYIAPFGTGKLDFTGNGVPDPSFFKTDSQGNVSLVIQDGADPANSFSLDLPERDLARLSVMGYFEINHDPGFKEIVLAEKNGQRYINPIVIDVNGAVLWDGSGKELLTIADMDGDNCEEIVVWLPIGPQVEMWGEKKN